MTTQPSLIGSGYNAFNIGGAGSSGATYYFALGCGCTISGNTVITTEAQAQITHRAAGTASMLAVYVSSNSRTAASTLRSRKNGSNGNQSASITATTTGLFQDVTNNDSISSGDTYNALITHGSGTQAQNIQQIYAMFQPSGSNPIVYFHASGSSPNASAASTTYRGPIGGFLGTSLNSSSDTTVDLHIRAAGTLSNFLIDVIANTKSSATTCGVRKGGSAGNNQVSVTATSTGQFEDVTNTDSVSNGNVANLYITTGTGTGNFTVRRLQVMFTGSSQAYDINLGTETTIQVLSGTTFYCALLGLLNTITSNTTEANVQIKMPFAGRASNLKLYYGLNNTSTTTVKLRKNGADGNQAVSVAAGGSGFVEDATSHDDFSATDLLNYSKGSAGGTSNSFNNIGMKIAQQSSIASGTGGGVIQVVT